MQSMEGKIVLVTGAKGGLGTYVTEAFLGAGATVAGVSRSIRQSDFAHPAFAAFPAELSSGEAARQLVEAVTARFARVDALIHVMGGFAGGQSVADTDDATVEKMLDLNYRSAFISPALCCPACARKRAAEYSPSPAAPRLSRRRPWVHTAPRRRR